MDLTLANFKQQIEDVILQRGMDYYQSGRVVDLKEANEGVWIARVEGAETYHVEIQQRSTGELSFECSCPYDLGPVCKHVAAVMYAIDTGFPSAVKNKPRKIAGKRQTRPEKVENILKGLAHEELVSLLAELAEEDREVAHRIRAQYGYEGSGKKAYIRLVKNALNFGKEHGFIDYWGSSRAARGVFTILERADAELEQGRAAQAVPIFQAVIEAVVPAMAHADDSDGALGNCIHWALKGLGEAGKQLSEKDKHELFGYCLAEAPSESYRGWDWGWNLAEIAADLVASANQRNHLFAVLDGIVASHREKGSDSVDRFVTEQAERIKLKVIERLDDEEAVEAFLVAHLRIEWFRERLVRFYIAHGNLVKARQLANEWLEQPNPRHPGYRDDFLKALLDIARLEKNGNEIARLAEELLYQTAEFRYYDLLKETIRKEAWPDFRDHLVETARQTYRHYYLAPEIMIREGLWELLLDFIRKAGPETVDHYRKHLEPRFPLEVSAIYERILRELLVRQADRGGYQMVCRYLRRMQKLGQGRRVAEIVAELHETYKRRPALMDELGML